MRRATVGSYGRGGSDPPVGLLPGPFKLRVEGVWFDVEVQLFLK